MSTDGADWALILDEHFARTDEIFASESEIASIEHAPASQRALDGTLDPALNNRAESDNN